MARIDKVALLGADGNLGPALLKAMVAAAFQVTVLKRESSKSATEYPSGVAVAQIPDAFPVKTLVEVLSGQDAVIVCIRSSDIDLQKRVAEAAAEAGVKRFIPADFGSCDSQSPFTQQLVPLYKRKTVLREHLEGLSARTPGFTWTSLVPGHFFDWSLQFIHIFLSERRADILDDGETYFSISTLARIAESTVRVLQRPEQTANRILYVQSFRVTQKQVIAAFEKATGVSWKVGRYDSKQFQLQEKKKADAGDLDAIEELVWLLGTVDADWTLREGYAMDLLGLHDEDLERVVEDVVARNS